MSDVSSRWHPKQLLFQALLVLVVQPMAANAVNYKTGIDMNFSGKQGVDYEIEQFYYDRRVFDKRVVYIKSTTNITAAHNSRNAKGQGTILTGGEADNGTIRYKVDQERRNDIAYNSDTCPELTGTVNFENMKYLDNSSVLGSIGDNGGNIKNLDGSYWTKGSLDSVGDEWHTFLVWDDDSWLGSKAATEYKASDGAYLLFVVNPKTPCIRWEVSGSGKFYTTPAKNYWTPVIFDQTTYFEGTVTCTIRDINGNNVFYRINGGSFKDAGSSSVTLDQNEFTNGLNTLEYYYAGNATHTKTRGVVKHPGFPSSGERHGNLLWKNSVGWSEVLSRQTIWPYEVTADRFRWDNNSHGQDSWNFRDGRRKTPTTAIINAFVAKRHGNDFSQQKLNGKGSSKSYAEFAKEMILDNARGMDAVGYERAWPSQAIPNKEQFYRGYWDVDTIYSMAFAYDILIAQYRSDQHASGITPVEDYFVRDCLASWAWEGLQIMSAFEGTGVGMRGMWGTCRQIGAIVCGMAMPTYSTRYYGTSGFDNTTTTTFKWCPWPDAQYTWKRALFDDKTTLPTPTGYPNLANKFNLEKLDGEATGLLDGDWNDKSGYFNYALCRHSFTILANLSKQLYPSRTWPKLFLTIERATKGTLNIGRRAMFLALNRNFPSDAARNIDWVLNRTDNEGIGSQMPDAKVYGVVWFDHDFDTNSPTGSSEDPTPPSRPSGVKGRISAQ